MGQVISIPILWAKASGMAMFLFTDGREGTLTMSSGHGHMKHYLTSSNNDYQSLFPGHSIFGSLSFLQAKYIHVTPSPPKGEKPNTLSWSYLSLKVYGLWVTWDGLWVTWDSLCSRKRYAVTSTSGQDGAPLCLETCD